MTHSPEQIEARALALHETRLANFKRNGWLQPDFEGKERAYCMQSATEALTEEAYQASLVAQHEADEADIARQLAAMTNAQLEANIALCDFEAAGRYPAETIEAAKAERRRYVAEQFRRSVAAGAEPFTASQAMITDLMCARVYGAVSLPSLEADVHPIAAE